MFITPVLGAGFSLKFDDGKILKVFRTLLSILADLNNSVVWIVSARSSIFDSSKSFTKPLWIIQSVPVTIRITVTFMLHTLFSSLARFKYLSLFSYFVIFLTLYSAETEKSTIRQVLFLFCSLLLGVEFLTMIRETGFNPRSSQTKDSKNCT